MSYTERQKMKSLDRYLFREMLAPFGAGVGLIVVMLVGNTLFPLIQTIVQYAVPFPVVLKMVAYNIPTVLTLTLPAGVALAAAWAVNRLARDSEITAVRMAGVPLVRLLAPIWTLGLVTSLVSLYVSDRVAPQSFRKQQETEQGMFAATLQASPTVAANKVFTYKNFSFHIGEIRPAPSGKSDELLLRQVTIYESPETPGAFPTLYLAKRANFTGGQWQLRDFVLHTFDRDGFTSVEGAGKSLTLNIGVPLSSLAQSGAVTPDEQSFADLGAEKSALSLTGQEATDAFHAVAFSYYARIALPFVCLAFAVCAPALALRFARTGAYTGIFLSIVLVWVGWNTLLVCRYLGLAGRVSPVLAAWFPDVFFLIIGIWLTRRAEA